MFYITASESTERVKNAPYVFPHFVFFFFFFLPTYQCCKLCMVRALTLKWILYIYSFYLNIFFSFSVLPTGFCFIWHYDYDMLSLYSEQYCLAFCCVRDWFQLSYHFRIWLCLMLILNNVINLRAFSINRPR